jgi:hypothetical protein
MDYLPGNYLNYLKTGPAAGHRQPATFFIPLWSH